MLPNLEARFDQAIRPVTWHYPLVRQKNNTAAQPSPILVAPPSSLQSLTPPLSSPLCHRGGTVVEVTFGSLNTIESMTLRNAVPGTDVTAVTVKSDDIFGKQVYGPTYYGATLYYVDKLILSPTAYELISAWRCLVF